MISKIALAGLAAALVEAAAPQGFNYGSTRGDGSAFMQSDFESMFKQAQNLPGTSGFNAARLYTMMQGGTSDTIISAIPAAISTKTNLLLGMWVSVAQGQDKDAGYKAEKSVFESALKQYGDQLKDLVVGISVGSEDLYRISPTGLSSANPGPGVQPDDLAGMIDDLKNSLKGGPLDGVPVGHVDTWTSWVNGSNVNVIKSADFLGVDAYPYWQDTQDNSIDNSQSLFNEALHNTQGASAGKQVWITETGFPVSGKASGQATPGSSDAQKYWQAVGCPNFGKVPTFWYTMEESPTAGNPDFSIFNAQAGQPYFDLSCDNVQNTTSSADSSSSTTGSSSSASTGTSSSGSTGSGSGNGTVSTGSPSAPSTGAGSSGSGSGSGSGSATGSTGSGSGSGSATGAAASASSTGPVAAGAASIGAYSVGSLIAIAAGIAALL